MVSRTRPLMLAYWGRRGALCRLTYNLAVTAAARGRTDLTISISRNNELFDEFAQLSHIVLPVDTFSTPIGAFFALPALVRLRRSLAGLLAAERTRAFVSLMPHVWSPLIAPVIQRAGVRHIVVSHDDDPHPGDRTAIVNRWLLREIRSADHVVTLSHAVAKRLTVVAGIPRERVSVLFLPDLDYGVVADTSCSRRTGPLRLLFFGRLLPYKGLTLFLDAVEILRRQSIAIEFGVFGAGNIGDDAGRLKALGGEVENRWIKENEFKLILGRFDLMVVSHITASQSGVVSTALGAGLPVVVTPVGGLTEQIETEINGLIASAVTAEAIAQSIRRIAEDRMLLERLRQGVLATAPQRSISRFLDAIAALAL